MSTQQIVNYPLLYINGLSCRVLSNTTFNVGAGICRDNTNSHDMNLGNFLEESNPNIPSFTTIVDTAVNGVNGLDTGTLANNTFYYVHVIGDSTGFRPTRALLSASASSPVLPFGYDLFRKVFNLRTDGSAHLLPCTISGNGNERIYQYHAPISILNASGSATPVSLTLTGAIPPSSSVIATGRGEISLSATFVPNTAANTFSLKPTSSATYPVVVSGPVVSQTLRVPPIVMLTDSTLDYVTSSASDALTLTVIGYIDFV